MRRSGLALALIIAAWPALACRPSGSTASSHEPSATPEPLAAPARETPGQRLVATVPLVDGGTLELDALRGEVVVLALALTSAPSFDELAPALMAPASRGDATVVVVAADPTLDGIASLPGAIVHGFDPQGALATRLQVRALPAVFVLDREGRVVQVWAGDAHEAVAGLPAALTRAGASG